MWFRGYKGWHDLENDKGVGESGRIEWFESE